MAACLLSLAVPTLAATGAGAGFYIAVGSAEGRPGEHVDVDVSFSGNPGVAAFVFRLNYDPSKLAPVSIAPGEALGAGDITSNVQSGADLSRTGFVSAVWVSPSDFLNDGVVCTVRFAIREGASGNIPLSLTYEAGGIVNQNYEDVAALIINGNVTAVGAPAAPESTPTPTPPSREQVASPGSAPQPNGEHATEALATPSPRLTPTPRPTPAPAGSGPEPGEGQPAWPGSASQSAREPGAPADSAPAEAWENPFLDVLPADWFYGSVQYACANGWMNGMSNDAFEPQTAVSRAMFVTVLHRLAGTPVPAPTSGARFSDAGAGQWHTEAILWASENGVVFGYGDRFGADDPISREQMATILFRYAALNGMDTPAGAGGLGQYADSGQVSPWAADAMEWACAAGIIGGRSATELAPAGSASRAEMAAMLQRFAASLVEG
ncbi:MAG: S-layer homology domain-containing protein [Clostridiales bacterium]|nr:S-layer homology domain-containing protein [Clostridiales bacterium]